MGLVADCPHSFCQHFFPSRVRLHSLHTHNEHATQILHWVCRSLPCIILWIASAVAPENFPNFPMFGRSTATCVSGHLFPFLSSEPTIVVLNFCSRTRMATSAQPPFHLSAFPSQKGYSQKTCREHQRTVWPCHSLASSQTQAHSAGSQGYPGIRSLPKPP